MIHSRATDKCVDVERGGLAEGTNIRQWSCNASSAQIWDVVDVGREHPQGNYFAGYYATKALTGLGTRGECPRGEAHWQDFLRRVREA